MVEAQGANGRFQVGEHDGAMIGMGALSCPAVLLPISSAIGISLSWGRFAGPAHQVFGTVKA